MNDEIRKAEEQLAAIPRSKEEDVENARENIKGFRQSQYVARHNDTATIEEIPETQPSYENLDMDAQSAL